MSGFVSQHLSEKLGTEVYIDKIEIGLFNRIIVNRLNVKDQKKRKLLSCEKLSVCVKMSSLLQEKFVIRTCKLTNANVNLIKDDVQSPYNFQFILDSLSSDKDSESKPLNLQLKCLIVRNLSIAHNLKFKPRAQSAFDANHCFVKDLNANISLQKLGNDSIDLLIRKVSGREQSGLEIEKLYAHLQAGKQRAIISKFDLKTKSSKIYGELIEAKYNKNFDFRKLSIIAHVKDSWINLAELNPLLPKMQFPDRQYNLRGTLRLESPFMEILNAQIHRGTHLNLEGHVRLHSNSQAKSLIQIKKCDIDSSEINFWSKTLLPSAQDVHPILSRLGMVSATGKIAYNKFFSNGTVQISSSIGSLKISASKNHNKVSLIAESADFNAGRLLDQQDFLGKTPFNIQASGQLSPNNEIDNAAARIKMQKAELKKHLYQQISVNLDYTHKKRTANFEIDIADPSADLTGHGTYCTAGENLSFTGNIKYLNPSKLNLVKESLLKHPLMGNISISTLNEGHTQETKLDLRNLTFIRPDENYTIHSIQFSKKQCKEEQDLSLSSDFLNAEVKGHISYATLPESLFYIIHKNTIGNNGSKRHPANQFSFRAQLLNSDFLKKVFEKDIRTEGESTISGYMNTTDNEFLMEGFIPHLEIDNQRYNLIRTYCKGKDKELKLLFQLNRQIGQNNVSLVAEAHNKNKILESSLEWKSNSSVKNEGRLAAKTQFFPDEQTLTTIQPSTVIIEDSLWNVDSSTIQSNKGHFDIQNLRLYRADRFLAIDGLVTRSSHDSLKIAVNKINLEYIFDLLNFHPVDFAGIASGTGIVTNFLHSPDANVSLRVENFHFNNGYMGNMNLDGTWNGDSKTVNLDAHITDSLKHNTHIEGKVEVAQKGLDLHFNSENTNMEFLNSFIPDVLSDIKGTYHGNCHLFGDFDKLNIEGEGIARLHMRISPLNTEYQMQGDSIFLYPDHIVIPRARITDNWGNGGVLSGDIKHSNFHNFSYEFRGQTNKLLVYNTTQSDAYSFWGKVFATGNVRMWGYPGAFNANINVRPDEHSTFTYNADQTENIEETQILTFHDKEQGKGTDSSAVAVAHLHQDDSEDEEKETDIHLNFMVEMNPNATLNVITDATANNGLSLIGDGILRASYYNKGKFEMYGTYELEDGSYNMTIQNFIKREFQFTKGSKITFNGDPLNGDLDMQGKYTVNSASLGDLNFGNTFSNKNVRVNCLLNFTGKVGAPQINFDLDIPNINDDEKQMVRNLISTQEDMNMQTLYLLSVGRFYTYDYAKYNSTQSQSSSALNSILSGTLSGQLNTMLSNAFKNNHWTIGTNLQTGTDGWNDMEVEGTFSGKFLSGRLLLGGSLGYRDQQLYNKTSLIGDFNVEYLLTKNGSVRLKAYSEENDRYFTKTSLTTQGGGIMLQRKFNRLNDLFRKSTFIKDEHRKVEKK